MFVDCVVGKNGGFQFCWSNYHQSQDQLFLPGSSKSPYQLSVC